MTVVLPEPLKVVLYCKLSCCSQKTFGRQQVHNKEIRIEFRLAVNSLLLLHDSPLGCGKGGGREGGRGRVGDEQRARDRRSTVSLCIRVYLLAAILRPSLYGTASRRDTIPLIPQARFRSGRPILGADQ